MGKRVIAVTEIHRTKKAGKSADLAKGTPAVRPEVQVIKAGSLFVTNSDAEFEELFKAGAVRVAEQVDKVSVEDVDVAEDEETKTKSSGKKAAPSRKKAPAKKAEAAGSEDEELV